MFGFNQCLGFGSGSGSESVGSARFWLPGKYADPRIRIQGAKYQPKNCKKKTFFTSKSKIWTLKKREIIKISSFLNGSSSCRIKICEKKLNKKFENYDSVNLIEMTWIQTRIRIWIRIHFFPVRIQDPDPNPHQK